MSIRPIAQYAKIKGLNIVGTGDFTHPLWLKEIKMELEEVPETGLYTTCTSKKPEILFMVTAEVHTLFNQDGKAKKIHHVVWTHSVDVAEQVNDVLSKYGSLSVDGRPTLQLTPPELVEIILSISKRNVVFPAHAWTPWFGLFGSFSGFDHLRDCYQDKTDSVFALETGLSSDPPMNWRISELDKIALVSNSDCHSYWPWRLGREANVLELDNLSYLDIVNTIKDNNPERFLFTIETNPAYGKYHWSGHRTCGVSMPASDVVKHSDTCPVCGRKMTKGVEQRVEELADRPEGFKPLNRPRHIHILPLSEIIASAIGSDSPATRRIWNMYNLLIERFGSEYNVLLKASLENLLKVADSKVAELIIRVREGRVRVITIMTGVSSPYILGKHRIRDFEAEPIPEFSELGIEVVK